MTMRFVFLDLDDTLLDFGAAERVALEKAFRALGVEPTDAFLARYKEINRAYWEAMERGEITRGEVLTGRFAALFAERGLAIDPVQCNAVYETHLAVGHWFVDGAPELLEYLFPKYELYLASNGVARTQYARLESADLYRWFRQIFISETTGHHKPEKAYFDYCFARIDGFDPEQAIIVGDSLSSDIQGGKNAGIRTCWFNPAGRPGRPELKPDYEIRSLAELRAVL